MKNVLVIDGQGGKIGALIVSEIRKRYPEAEVSAVGTNAAATAAMLKAGAHYGATGENPVVVFRVVVAARKADVIIGPTGMVIADALLGEVTEKMAVAVGRSDAAKLLIPINKCNTVVVGVEEKPVAEYAAMAVEKLREYLA